MCFHSRQTKKATELENRFNAKTVAASEILVSDHINGFEYPHTPVVADAEPTIIQQYQWGLIPSWCKDDSIKKYTLNAKIETLHEKPSFRNSVNKRCLVISDGFYEWQWLDPKGKNKQRYLITLPNDELFAFAGIWSEWEDKVNGQKLFSYSIVTTVANELMSEIHNTKKRMPIVLPREMESYWLQKGAVGDFAKLDVELKAKAAS